MMKSGSSTYDIGNTPTERQKYELLRINPVNYAVSRYIPSRLENKYQFNSGEFPIMKDILPNLFGQGYAGRPYSATDMIQEDAKMKGYKKPSLISLPYLGSSESQTNKTRI